MPDGPAPDETLDLFSAPPPPPGEEAGLQEEPAGPEVWSVSDLNARAKRLLESGLGDVWISGEIANWTRARSGHCYFTLKDESAQVRCVMFRGHADRLPMDPEEGMQVRVAGGVSLYVQRGEYQVTVREMELEGGEGLWKLAFDRLRRQLEGEGLLDAARKRPIPGFPRRVGVVTSPTGAAVRDVLRVIHRRAPWTQVVIRGTRVQGQGASEEVAAALDHLAAVGNCDVIIVGRGGGSIEDLWAFNEEPVARAIARCPVPVISAVGHETDVTISDLVADLRAPTPSAAAEAAVPDRDMVEALLRKVEPRLSRALRSVVERRGNRIREARLRLLRGMERRLEPARQTLDRNWDRMSRGLRDMVRTRRERMASLSGRLDALSPLKTLGRGYSVTTDAGGRVLRRAGDFAVGETVRIRVVDGQVRAEVKEIERLEDLG